MNPLEKLVKTFGAFPWLLSYVLGRTVKFVGTTGIRYEKFNRDEIVLSIKNRNRVQNHIGQVHAMVMALLAETATGMMVGINIPKGKTPLLKSIDCAYVRRSSGKITVRTDFDDERRAVLEKEDKGEVEFKLDAVDQTGEVVAQYRAVWAWRKLKKS